MVAAAVLQNNSELHSSLIKPSQGYEALIRKNAQGQNTLSVLVDGVHCAACIQKIESSLYQNPNVVGARLNFSTGALNIIWTGAPDSADGFIQNIESLGYTVRPYSASQEKISADKEDRFLLLCLGVAGFAMGNIMLLSVGLWTTTPETMGMATRDFMHMISAIIAVPTVMFSGRPFFNSAIKALSSGTTNMDVPISVGLLLATGISLFETFNHGEHAYFDSAIMLIFFLLIGRYLDFRARRMARSAANNLMQSFTGFASVLDGDHIRKILIRDLREGMSVSVAAGEKFPIDGTIDKGESTVDTSLVTGETLPRNIKPNSIVYAGTLNLSAPVIVKVLKAAEDSLLAEIVRLMEKAEQAQAKYVRLADKAAKLYTPVVHLLAAIAFFYWFWIVAIPLEDAVMIAATVLIITCPCALGLAVPVVQVIAIGRLMKSNILVKSGDALERLASIDTVIFDKTGTLTLGKPVLRGIYNAQDLQLAASLAAHSKHVLAQAILSAYTGPLLSIINIVEHSGKGMEGIYNGQRIFLGRKNWCGDLNAAEHEGQELWLRREKEQAICFFISDSTRVDSQDVIRILDQRNLKTMLLSGDRKTEAARIAQELGIQEFYGEMTPPEKYEILRQLKAQNRKIMMVGDGLNDAPALMEADVSMAPGSAIDMAQNAADIVFMGDRLSPVTQALEIACKTQVLIMQNFALAIIYNIIAIPMAFCGYVTPLIAALAMSGSSLIVVLNSCRLRARK